MANQTTGFDTTMDIILSLYEMRVIGALMEKEVTTPDQYPLSLNALTTACNQKSNRDPVLDLDEATVQLTLDGLLEKRLVMQQRHGSRVVKYQQRFCNTEFSKLQLSDQEFAILCVLLLRGPQTPGELRTRTSRLCEFNNVDEVEAVLDDMQQQSSGPLVCKLDREPGKRECRYMHMFNEGPLTSTPFSSDEEEFFAEDVQRGEQRIHALEEEVNRMRTELEDIRQKLEQVLGD